MPRGALLDDHDGTAEIVATALLRRLRAYVERIVDGYACRWLREKLSA